MAARVRSDGTVVCAAMFPAEEGDIYIEDSLHYELTVELGLLEADPNHKVNGLWYWSFPSQFMKKGEK